MTVGAHLVRMTATTQTVIATSSGESEFYAVVEGMAMALGLRAMGRDWGIDLFPRLRMDATAPAAEGDAWRIRVGGKVVPVASGTWDAPNI